MYKAGTVFLVVEGSTMPNLEKQFVGSLVELIEDLPKHHVHRMNQGSYCIPVFIEVNTRNKVSLLLHSDIGAAENEVILARNVD